MKPTQVSHFNFFFFFYWGWGGGWMGRMMIFSYDLFVGIWEAIHIHTVLFSRIFFKLAKLFFKPKLISFWHVFKNIFYHKRIKLEGALIGKVCNRTVFQFSDKSRKCCQSFRTRQRWKGKKCRPETTIDNNSSSHSLISCTNVLCCFSEAKYIFARRLMINMSHFENVVVMTSKNYW